MIGLMTRRILLTIALLSAWGIQAAGMNSANAVVAGSAELQLASVLSAEHDGKLLLALTRAREVADAHQDHVLAQLAYGRLMVKNGDADGAITVMQPLVQQLPDDWRPWFWLGSAQLMGGDLLAAAYSLDEALAREGEQAALWVQRAIVEQERGNPQAAMHYLQVANGIDPENLDVLFNFAYATEQSGEAARAAMLYRHFLRLSAASPAHGHLRRLVLKRLPRLVAAAPKGDISPAKEDSAVKSSQLDAVEADW